LHSPSVRKMSRRSALRRFSPVIFWALLILGISSIPHLSSAGAPFRIGDKVAHFVEYGILGFLLASAWIPSGPAGMRWNIAAVLFVCILFGCLDEMYQLLIPGRSSDALDVVAVARGVVMAVILWSLWRRWRIRSLREGQQA
jgi:hypothetical protein